MIFWKIPCLVSIVLLFSIQGCNFFREGKDKFIVKIKFAGENSSQKLEDVRAIVGSDKFWWNSIESGHEESVNLFSEKNAVNNLTLFYKIDGREMYWESERFSENSDYRIDIIIEKEGQIKNIICKLPC